MKERMEYSFQKEVEAIKDHFGFDYTALALVQSPERRFEIRWVHVAGNLNNRYRRIALQSGKGIAGLVFKTGKPMYVENAGLQLDPANLYHYPIVVAEQLKSFGAIPLYKYNRVSGVLLVGYRTAGMLTKEKFASFRDDLGRIIGPFYSSEKVQE